MAVDLAERFRARREARFHIQVRLESIPSAIATPGEVRVAGRVTRLFRSKGDLTVGDPVAFTLRVYQRGEHVPPGVAYLLEGDLRRAEYIEAFLNGKPPNCEVPLEEYALLAGPQANASMTIGDREVRLNAGATSMTNPRCRRWWRFWAD